MLEHHFRSPLSKLGSIRRTHIYCVGTAKSGTNSLASLYQGELRTHHEADAKRVINLILGRRQGTVSSDTLREELRKRDRSYMLDLDSSQINYFYLPELLELFPQAKFLLTLREPRSWLDSYINHQLSRDGVTEEWRRFRDLRFRQDGLPHPPEERALASRDLYTLDGYLAYWARHNRDVLQLVPPSRLMVIRTHEITSRLPDIARFVGVAPRNLGEMSTRAHANKARRKHNVLEQIDGDYLHHKIQTHCGDLTHEFFPDKLGS